MSHTKCPECNLIFTPKNHEDEIKTLRAENARYREALLSISKPDPMFIGGPEAYRYKTIAREALKGE